jgi:hypothetical protein
VHGVILGKAVDREGSGEQSMLSLHPSVILSSSEDMVQDRGAKRKPPQALCAFMYRTMW